MKDNNMNKNKILITDDHRDFRCIANNLLFKFSNNFVCRRITYRAINIIVLTALIVLVTGTTALAQSVANYTPTRATGITYNSILSTGNAISAWRNINVGDYYDDNRSQPVLIGFDFWYAGKRYTQFSVSTNGFLDLDSSSWNGGSGAVQPQNPYGPYSTDFVNPTRSAPSGGVGTVTALAPFYYDLTTWQTSVPLGNSIKYLVTGVAPNRVLTVEWNNMSTWTNQDDTLNFQAMLYESTGVIEYNYGYMSGTISTTYGFGYVTGINGPSISPNPPTAAQLLCLQTANTNSFSNGQQNQLSTMTQSYSKYTFTPTTPVNPSSLTFTSIAPTSMTLNWNDNANNEVGYVIYSSLDGSNYLFLTQLAANSTTYAATGLTPGTTYYWRVYAVTEGRLSASLDGSQATSAAINYTSAQTGLWNTGTTWVGGAVPDSNSNVTIADGQTVTIDGNITINNITVGQGTSGTLLIGNSTTALTLNVLGDITVNAGAQFTVNTNYATSGHMLNLTGNILNNGTFDLGPNASSRCRATFNRSGNQTISGTGTTTRFYLVTLNMGTTNSNVLEVTASNFLTQSAGFLTIMNGTFKYEAPNALTPFTANTTIPLTGGLWVNNSSAIVTTTGGNLSVTGYVRVTDGVLNVGTAADQQLLSNGGTFIIEGGTVNIAGNFTSDPYAVMHFTISGGAFIVPTVGSTLSGQAPFMLSIAGSTFNQTGGTIVIRRAGNGNLGYINTNTSSSSVLGGTLQIGDYNTPATQTIQINSTIPVYNLIDSSTQATAQLMTNNLTVKNDVHIAAGTLNANNLDIEVQGNWTNQGTFTPGSGTVIFSGPANSVITKVAGETFNNLTINKTSGEVSLGDALTINGTLNFASAHNLILGTNNLTLGGSVSNAAAGRCIVTNSTGGVVRNIAASSAGVFPIGPDATHYNPVTLTSDASHTTDNFTVTAAAGSIIPAVTDNSQAVQVTWSIAEAVAGGSSVTINLGWTSSQHGTTFSTSAASLWHYDASTWQDLLSGTVQGTDPYTLSTSGPVSSFSPFCVGNSGALPVEVTSFTATSNGSSAQLRWITATENKSYNFEIERRLTGTSEYIKVGTVKAAGTSNSERVYEFNDINIAAGQYIYRLKMNDNDGSFEYFGNAEVVINTIPKELSLKSNYPNPFNPSTTIEFTLPENGHVALKVFNIVGQQVATLFDGMANAEQEHKVTFDASRLSSGVYFSILEFGNQRLVRKMMLTK